MASEYTTFKCNLCGAVFPINQGHECKRAVTEARAYEIAREVADERIALSRKRVNWLDLRKEILEQAPVGCGHAEREELRLKSRPPVESGPVCRACGKVFQPGKSHDCHEPPPPAAPSAEQKSIWMNWNDQIHVLNEDSELGRYAQEISTLRTRIAESENRRIALVGELRETDKARDALKEDNNVLHGDLALAQMQRDELRTRLDYEIEQFKGADRGRADAIAARDALKAELAEAERAIRAAYDAVPWGWNDEDGHKLVKRMLPILNEARTRTGRLGGAKEPK